MAISYNGEYDSVIWGVGAVLIILYIAGTCRWGSALFSDKIFIIRWMKSSGYYFYRKIICRYLENETNLSEHKNYRRMQQIYVKKDVSTEWREYQAKKYALLLTGLLSVSIAGGIFFIIAKNTVAITELELQRPDYGEADREYSFLAKTDDGEEEIDLTLEARIYSQEEIQKIFEEYYEALFYKVKGKNQNLQEIRTALDFEPDIKWKGIDISWSTSDYNLISEEGKVFLDHAKEGKTQVNLYLSMSHDQYSKMFEIPVTIVKYASDSTDSLQSYLKRKQEENPEEEMMELPQTFNGKKIQYFFSTGNSMGAGVVLLIITIVFLFLYRQQSILKEQCTKREKQMKEDYSEIISKLLILIRAGMPVKSAWMRIVEEYQQQRRKGYPIHYAQEEMTAAIRKMENGSSEGEAYLEFGKRCGQHLYLKLGSLLEQNLKKGNYGIAKILESERIQSLEERRREVRAEGELAGTKLMMPMIVLFALVLLIIMVPSFMTFGN